VRRFWTDWADKVGPLGAIAAALCCLGFPAALALLSALGLGFVINDAILLPLLGVFLAITLVGLAAGTHRHGRQWPLVLGAIAAAVTFGFLFVAPAVSYLGGAGVVVAAAANIALRARQLRRR